MFHLLEILQTLDPATAEFVWTASVTTLLMLSTAIALWMLPWSDEEINEVDQSFNKLVSQITIPRAEPRSRLAQIHR
jgi:hypothetical protein